MDKKHVQLEDHIVQLYKPVYDNRESVTHIDLDTFQERYNSTLFRIDFNFGSEPLAVSFKKKDRFNIPYFETWEPFKDRHNFESYFPRESEELKMIRKYIEEH